MCCNWKLVMVLLELRVNVYMSVGWLMLGSSEV